MNVENITIEKNIPMLAGPRTRQGKYDTLLRSMEVGDSFATVLPSDTKARANAMSNLRATVTRMSKVFGYKFSVRTLPGSEAARTWRVS